MSLRHVTALAAGVLLLAWPAAGEGSDPVLQMFKAQREIEKRLLGSELATMERVQEQLRGACDRLVRLGDDLLRAQKDKDGEDLGSFMARSADLRHAEAEVNDLIASAQQLRITLGARREYLEQVQIEIRRMEESSQATPDEVSGHWLVAVEPGGFTGTFDLRLDGTIVTGLYQLSGGWKGSLRGTFIGGDVRLERIDTQQGFVAVYTGRLVSQDNERRFEGTWDATNLAAGMPTSGTWVGRREVRP